MVRWLVLAMVTTGLAFSACGSSETKKTDDTPAWTAAPDAEAIVGAWKSGDNSVTFDANGNYRWEKAIPCGNPPCPTSASSGTYRITHGKLYLDPQQGDDQIVEFTFGDMQKSVSLKDATGSWSLNKQ